MPVIEDRIYERLVNSTIITGLVSTRIFPYKIPQGCNLPAITFTRISGVPEHAMGSDPGLTHSRFQITCWAEAPEDGTSMAEAVKSIMSRWASSTSGPYVQAVFIENELIGWTEIGAEDVGVYHQQLDLLIHSMTT